VQTWGIPIVEKQWPFLTPIINEVIAIIGGTPPSSKMVASAEQYNAVGVKA
jgi:hypothetical protein